MLDDMSQEMYDFLVEVVEDTKKFLTQTQKIILKPILSGSVDKTTINWYYDTSFGHIYMDPTTKVHVGNLEFHIQERYKYEKLSVYTNKITYVCAISDPNCIENMWRCVIDDLHKRWSEQIPVLCRTPLDSVNKAKAKEVLLILEDLKSKIPGKR